MPETFAVFLLPVQKGLDVSRSEITLTYSCYMLAYGLSAPFAGQLIDRLGARITYGFGLASLGLGYLIAGSATGLWQYLLGVVAASAFGMTGMLSVVGMLTIGWLSDRIGRRQAATLSYLSTIVGMLALISVAVWPSLLLIYAFVWFFGLMQGARGPIIVDMVATLFPGGGVGAIYGTLSLAMGGGAALGSLASGLLYELTGGYVASFGLGVAGALVGMLSFWAFRSLREETAIRRG